MATNKAIEPKITSVIAREENGNIQITFTIPYTLIEASKEETVKEMAQDVQVPGFRRGAAPLSKVREKIPETKLVEHALGHLLPKALGEAVEVNKLTIAIYPKFELLKADTNEDWQVRGITCELPNIDLGNYKSEVAGALRSDSIVVPGQDNPKEKTREQKESIALKALLDQVKVKIPQILIEEESTSRLSNLLARLEKLGLALESYLASINKKVEDLRAEYAIQSKEAITIDLALNKVAEEESIKVDPDELEQAFKIAEASNPQKTTLQEDTLSRKRLLESILKRRKALDFLIGLA